MSDDKVTHSSSDDATPMAKMLFGWTEAKSAPTLFMVFIIIVSIILFIVDFFIDKHAYKPVQFSEMPTFYGLYGFAAFTFVVLCGWPLGKRLRKDENYYGDLDDGADDTPFGTDKDEEGK